MMDRYRSIQYLRGVAATLVVASHAFLYPLTDEPMLYGRWGWLGVILFFVISGFIMVTVTGNGRFDGGLFIRRRAIRVIPLYWAVTLLTAVLALWAPSLFKTMTFDFSQLWRSLLFVPFFNETSGGIHPIYKLGWTLNYEVYFYLCFALLWFLGSTSRVVTLTVIFAGLATFGFVAGPTTDLSAFYTSYIPLAFCAGMGLGLMALDGSYRASTGFMIAVGVVGGAGLVFGLAWPASRVEDWTAFIGCLAFAVAVVFIGVQSERALPKVALLERVGDASYSTYLFHIYVVGALSWLAYTVLPSGNGVVYVTVAITTIVCATAFGLLLHKSLELPVGRCLAPLSARSPRETSAAKA
ncbi:acyltransferase family protein [Devosia limi]|uniref:Peptidoglycan/LPS O-acetylase OafA/YrhL, contains acyltransferase and SGNH-hydrolase domains n=1 Tax=Devosia limi DSM 17137 TaxID=1121477 RepID=A0A1M5CIY5_9HYPH|nr:acyltransferase [Devosia limi]SHF54547.1 Peptidoglycan/LPS O-acetylase OafA/YrhL, contains acyltransferase and SGNH-hydrolase domains [Devosia limi DSM 17137]